MNLYIRLAILLPWAQAVAERRYNLLSFIFISPFFLRIELILIARLGGGREWRIRESSGSYRQSGRNEHFRTRWPCTTRLSSCFISARKGISWYLWVKAHSLPRYGSQSPGKGDHLFTGKMFIINCKRVSVSTSCVSCRSLLRLCRPPILPVYSMEKEERTEISKEVARVSSNIHSISFFIAFSSISPYLISSFWERERDRKRVAKVSSLLLQNTTPSLHHLRYPSLYPNRYWLPCLVNCYKWRFVALFSYSCRFFFCSPFLYQTTASCSSRPLLASSSLLSISSRAGLSLLTCFWTSYLQSMSWTCSLKSTTYFC